MTNVGRSMTVEGERNADFIKQKTLERGVMMDDPASAKGIPDFIAFHNLNMDEVRDPTTPAPTSSWTRPCRLRCCRARPRDWRRSPRDPCPPCHLNGGWMPQPWG